MNLPTPIFADTALVALIVISILLLVLVIWAFNYLIIFIRAWASGAYASPIELIGLGLRKVPVGMIVNERITAIKSGHMLSIDDLSTHHLAGGNISLVVQALIAAQKATIRLSFDRACAIDLATKGTTKNVLEAVKTSINPKVIDCPNPTSGKASIDAVASDGIVIRARARVTVRTNLDRFVGGATEETIVARVGEGIVSTIGSAETYKKVLQNPDMISKTVLGKSLDSNTAFEILSIDIADIDVGSNVGAKLQSEQAEANKLIAQAQAEVRRAAAVAKEHEMRARVEEMRARVVEAEAQIPLAMAEAFRSGNIGIMDYYRFKNIQADTGMRDSISKSGEDGLNDHKD